MEDLDLVTIALPRMRARLIQLTDKATLLQDADPVTSNELFAKCWEIRKEAYPMMVKLFDAGGDVTPSDFGWSVEQLVADSLRSWLCKSAKTPELESTPYKLGPNGLWHTPNKKHPGKEKLPNYIEHIAHALMRDQGMGESQAIATAINAAKRWANGDLHWGRGKVHPEVQHASQRALDEWEKLKEGHKG
jgi:hypothetical protein